MSLKERVNSTGFRKNQVQAIGSKKVCCIIMFIMYSKYIYINLHINALKIDEEIIGHWRSHQRGCINNI